MDLYKIDKKEKLMLFFVFFMIFNQTIFKEEGILILQFILLFIYLVKNKVVFNIRFLLIMGLVLIHGIINSLLRNYDTQLVLKQIIGISISFIFYYNFLHKIPTKIIFFYYMKFAVFLSFLGIAQEIAYFLRISPLYNVKWLIGHYNIGEGIGGLLRVNIVFYEPSILAYALAPAVYIAIKTLIYGENEYINRFYSIIILLVYFLTFSSLAYIGVLIIFVSLILQSKNVLKKIAAVIVACLFVYFIYSFIPLFKDRLDDTIKLLNQEQITTSNISSEVLVANFKIAIKSTKDNFGMGTGIGGYVYQYDKYKNEVYAIVRGVNSYSIKDANSLFLRILTECGVPGLIIFILIIIKYYIFKGEIYGDISNALLVDILLRGIRGGHYFAGEIIFILVLYILNYCEYRNRKKEINGIN